MNINYNKYLNFYNDYSEKIKIAYNCSVNNPCKKVIENIEQLIKFLNTKKSISWVGTAREEFDDGINKCIANFNTIKASINSVWQDAEEIYEQVNIELDNLYKKYTTLVGIIKNGKPRVEDFEKVVKNPDGTLTVTTPGYSSAYKRWQYKCRVYDTSCHSICDLIDGLLVKLKTCDSTVITLVRASMAAHNEHLDMLLESGYALNSNDMIQSVINSGKAIFYRDEESGLLNVRYNQGMGPRIGGVSLADSGCSIMSYASALTAIYTRRHEQDVYVLPEHIATAITDKYGKLSRFFTPGSGFNGFGLDENITKDISGIYDVAILYSKDYKPSGEGVISAEQVNTVAKNNGCVVGSMLNKSHLVAITGVSTEGTEYVANTYKYAREHISGAPEHTKLKYYSTVFDSIAVELKEGKVYLNGESNFDIGNITNVAVGGEDIPVKRVLVSGENEMPIYEYKYDVVM